MTGDGDLAPPAKAQRILRINRVVADLDRAEAFYCNALGFRVVARRPADGSILAALGAGDNPAEEAVLRLGAEEIALVCFAVPGRPYPPQSRSDDLWFQHLAIVVSDMDAAYARLSATPGWNPISGGGPQTLPPSDGAVRAFKFRDPDGHPLELLWFPLGQGRAVWHKGGPGPFLGIDHSGLAVSSTRQSVKFYTALGFSVTARSLNRGPPQERLDGISPVRTMVTGLRPASDAGPGLELLGYEPAGRAAAIGAPNDLVTDWITLAVASATGPVPHALRDPDGHRLVLVDHGNGGTGAPA
jgi:catechol 2,3-dioxygenase-like lactoylglutathione lyase family enzyme